MSECIGLVIKYITGIDERMARRLVTLASALRALKEHDLEEAASPRLLVYAAGRRRGPSLPGDALRCP
ncbi:MAG: hypothetical protein GY792_24165 [Gammaproteobacteria bacterium]|nr:hypothetical protein [Gammaproteobacteria bacterium]